MTNYIITKWIEPYVLLENAKKNYQMKDYTFDGFNKLNVKKDFLKGINSPSTFGLYMKNVNKFYLFNSDTSIDVEKFLKDTVGLSDGDFYTTDNCDEPFDKIDLGKAEAAFLAA